MPLTYDAIKLSFAYSFDGDISYHIHDFISIKRKPYEYASVEELNALNVNKSMDGNIYILTDSGILTHGNKSVLAGSVLEISFSSSNQWSWSDYDYTTYYVFLNDTKTDKYMYASQTGDIAGLPMYVKIEYI